MVVVISDDVVIDILHRLPWKSVVQFKLVSKDWLRLISTHYFVSSYQARNFPLMEIYYKEGSIQKFIQTDHHNDANTTPYTYFDLLSPILNSSNGLLLCFYLNVYLFYNPISGECSSEISLPNIDSVTARCGKYVYSHTQKVPKRHLFAVQGFVYDPYSNPPCVTLTELFSDTNSLYVSTYSSKTTVWSQKIHENVLPYLGSECCMLVGRSTYLKGAFHWICAARFGRILAYDINTDNFRLLCIPCDHNKDDYRKESIESSSYDFLGEISDHLFYTRIANNYSIHLWIQDDYNRDIWSPRRCIVMYNLRNNGLTLREVIAFDPRNTQVVFLRTETKIVSYNIQTGECKELCTLNWDGLSHSHRCCPYQMPRSPTFMPPPANNIRRFSIVQQWRSV